MKILNVKLEEKELSKKQIEENKLFNVYLFGLPRSGTSMTTHILELLGVNMIYTSEDYKEDTDKRFRDKYGEYHANPNGFFEITNNAFMNYLRILSTPYSGCKMIIPVMDIRWEVVKNFPSKVILMTRDLEEIRQSQMAYYSPKTSIGYLRSALVQQRLLLENYNIDFLEINYNELLKDKVNIINKIKGFIKSDNDIQEAVDFVNPKQNRFRRKQLVSGL